MSFLTGQGENRIIFVDILKYKVFLKVRLYHYEKNRNSDGQSQ